MIERIKKLFTGVPRQKKPILDELLEYRRQRTFGNKDTTRKK